jgi:hypothetical protein
MSNELTFDDMYLNAPEPEAKRELREMRADNSLLLTQQMEMFVAEIVLHGRTPMLAYERAFAVEDRELGTWVKPDNPSWEASRLLKLPEVIGRIKEIRDMVVLNAGLLSREEVINNLRSIALDPHAKHSDRLSASKQLSQLEGYEKAPDVAAGGNITINLPWVPNELKTVSGVTLDNEPQPL